MSGSTLALPHRASDTVDDPFALRRADGSASTIDVSVDPAVPVAP